MVNRELMDNVKRRLEKGGEVYVEGKPGAGKTTFVYDFIREYPFETFLVLTYNRENRKKNRKKMPGNAVPHTLHSLAYSEVGEFFSHKMTKNISVVDIVDFFGDMRRSGGIMNQEVASKAAAVLSAVERFLVSEKETVREVEADEEIAKKAQEYVDSMFDTGSDTKITDNGYLKFFQLSSPFLKYDYIVVDEAQDITGLMESIVKKQNHAKILWVGDPDQMIYDYSGSIDIFEGKEKVSIQKTWRFGEEISDVANFFIRKFKPEAAEIIPAEIESVVGEIDPSDFRTVIFRTNAGIFDKAVELMERNEEFSITGGADSIFKHISDVYSLCIGDIESISDRTIKKFRSFEGLKKAAKRISDPEINYSIKVVEKYGVKTKELMRMIFFRSKPVMFAKYNLITAHKSKGLEFFNVQIADDFFSMFTKEGEFVAAYPTAEVNLYYVAITRAVERLELNKELRRLYCGRE